MVDQLGEHLSRRPKFVSLDEDERFYHWIFLSCLYVQSGCIPIQQKLIIVQRYAADSIIEEACASRRPNRGVKKIESVSSTLVKMMTIYYTFQHSIEDENHYLVKRICQIFSGELSHHLQEQGKSSAGLSSQANRTNTTTSFRSWISHSNLLAS